MPRILTPSAERTCRPECDGSDRCFVEGSKSPRVVAMVLALVTVPTLAETSDTVPSIDRGSKVSIPAIEREAPRTEAEARISQELTRDHDAGSDLRTFGQSGAADKPVRVEVIMDSLGEAQVTEFKQIGDVRVDHASTKYNRLALTVSDLDRLEEIASIHGVIHVRRLPEAMTHVVPRRSGRAVGSDELLAIEPGLTGQGQTVGILSDSFAHTIDSGTGEVPDGVRVEGQTTPAPCESGELRGARNQDLGELPATVTLVKDDFPAAAGDCDSASDAGVIDEGAAMAELVHAVAPGAGIAFHTAAGGPAVFAEGIDALCESAADGGIDADVVVDDLIYPTTSLMYQPDIVAEAAMACIERGTPYLAAAGNFADRGFREVFEGEELGEGVARHLWDTDTDYLVIALAPGARISPVLQWNQPALSSPSNEHNGPQVDLDMGLYDLAAGAYVANSRDDQKPEDPAAGADPVESFSFTNRTVGTRVYGLVIESPEGDVDKIPQDPGTDLEFRLVFPNSDAPAEISIAYLDEAPDNQDQPPVPGPTMYGQGIAPGVIAVGAVGWYQSPGWDPAEVNTAETDPRSFSAKGGVLPYQFAADGSFTGGTTARKPDLAAVDGDNTTFFGSTEGPTGQDGEPDQWPNFTGTSAAAPVAAGVIALLQEYAEDVVPDAMRAVLQDKAVDVTGERAAPGPDDVTGSGLLDGEAAFAEFPRADAGTSRTVDEGDSVELDGSRSSGSQSGGEVEGYAWTQVAGDTVDLTGEDSASASFTAPATGSTLRFHLTVANGRDLTHADTVEIAVNRRPVADAGGSSTVMPGADVVLDGSGSSDADGDAPSFSWRQLAGSAVDLTDAATSAPEFTAPGETGRLEFELEVSDGRLAATDTVSVEVREPPVADAGDDLAVDVDEDVSLDGNDSASPAGDDLSFSWNQVDGQAVELDAATAGEPAFTAPSEPTTLTFELTVSDGELTDTDRVEVDVEPREEESSSGGGGGSSSGGASGWLSMLVLLLLAGLAKASESTATARRRRAV